MTEGFGYLSKYEEFRKITEDPLLRHTTILNCRKIQPDPKKNQDYLRFFYFLFFPNGGDGLGFQQSWRR